VEAPRWQRHDRQGHQRCQPPCWEQLVLAGKKLPMAQQEGHRSMCQASSSAAKFFFVKNNIKVNQLVNGWVTNCNDVCTQITTLPSMQLQKEKLKKEQKKIKGMCAKRV